ncbi:MAG: hypothetical protein ACTS1X_01930 [Parasphingopyxis sp.]|uniref:hypothetical protein n=1 Tax=Parasphingopyxis sp. TaxID=1920299 RepID=UPI003F9F90A5
MKPGHPIFEDNPVAGSVELSTGPAPTPYRVHDGEALLIFGDVASDRMRQSIDGEAVHPVEMAPGRAAAGFIMADFRQASMGAHGELQFFALVSEREGESIEDAPLALPIAMATRPDWGTLCCNLWNDLDSVVAYNNEYLGLNARHAAFRLFEKSQGRSVGFAVSDEAGNAIIEGRFQPRRSTPFSAMWEMMRIAGMRDLIALGRAPYVRGNVVNRIGSVMPKNRKAPIFTSSDRNVARHWDPRVDKLEIAEPALSALDFRPRALQHLRPFRFVYRHPDDTV